MKSNELMTGPQAIQNLLQASFGKTRSTVGVIVPFPMNHIRMCSQELGLLTMLTSDVQSMWRGGWAERGEPDGVVLLRNQQVIGVWFYQSDRYCYVPISEGVITHRTIELADAFSFSLNLLGPIPD